MPRWVVQCANCHREFTHSLVHEITQGSGGRDVFASPPKPAIPEGGSALNCPHCGTVQSYKMFDLRYRAQ